MEATQEQVRKGKGSVGVIIFGVVLLALVLAAAYYQSELLTYVRLQGWDTGAVKETMKRFVQEAHDGQTSAGDLLDTDWAKPVVEGGKFVGVSQSGAHGPFTTKTTVFIPDGTMSDCAVRIKNKSGVFEADVKYPNGQWAQFDVARVKDGLRIRSVPVALSPTQPQPQSWD